MSDSPSSNTPHELVLTQELSRYRPRRSQRYTAVNVLIVTWIEDDIGVAGEVEELVRLFRSDFKYLVWEYRIPSDNAQSELQVHISQFIRQCGSDEDALILLYYSGHGGQTRDRMSSEFVWAA